MAGPIATWYTRPMVALLAILFLCVALAGLMAIWDDADDLRRRRDLAAAREQLIADLRRERGER